MSALDKTGLEPCPFCGGTAKYLFREVPLSKWRHRIVCAGTTCGMEGPVEASKADAVTAWNRRASATSAGVTEEQVELDDCPEGLFWFDGALCFMSEYATVAKDERRQRDAYVVSCGEYFWGGVSTAEERSKLMVQPITNPEAALEASRVAPASQKEADGVPSALDRIIADDCLKRARSKLSFDEIKKMIDHTKAAIREGGSNA